MYIHVHILKSKDKYEIDNLTCKKKLFWDTNKWESIWQCRGRFKADLQSSEGFGQVHVMHGVCLKMQITHQTSDQHAKHMNMSEFLLRYAACVNRQMQRNSGVTLGQVHIRNRSIECIVTRPCTHFLKSQAMNDLRLTAYKSNNPNLNHVLSRS